MRTLRAMLIVPLLVGLVLLTIAGCAGEPEGPGDGIGPELAATVVKGIELAPAEMRGTGQPVARHLADSEVIVYVSGPMYSGSCPPTGDVEASGADKVTLTIDTGGGNCTADANRYTFLIQGFTGSPAELIVIDEGQEAIELDLTD